MGDEINARSRITADPYGGTILVNKDLEIQYVDKKWNTSTSFDPPYGELKDPNRSKPVLQDIVAALKLTTEPTAVVKERAPPSEARCIHPDQGRWWQELAYNRAQCVKNEIVKMGIPESQLTVKVIEGDKGRTYVETRFLKTFGEVKKMQLDMSDDLIDRMRKQFMSGAGRMAPDRLARFLDRNKTGSLSLDDIKHLIRSWTGRDEPALVKDGEVNIFVKAMNSDGSGAVKVDALVEFITLGAKGSCKSPRGQTRPASWVPRVATLAYGRKDANSAHVFVDPEEEAINNKALAARTRPGGLRHRGSGLGLKIDTSDQHKRPGGFNWERKLVSPKVGEDESRRSTSEPPMERVQRMRFNKDEEYDTLTPKLTGERRDLKEKRPSAPGELPSFWSKINHCSQGVNACPEKTLMHKCQSEKVIPTRIGGEEVVIRSPRKELTAKVTEIRREVLPTSPAEVSPKCKSVPWEVKSKLTDPGRTAHGWASPYAANRLELSRPLEQRQEMIHGRAPVNTDRGWY